MHCIFKNPDPSHCSLLGTYQMICLFLENDMLRTKVTKPPRQQVRLLQQQPYQCCAEWRHYFMCLAGSVLPYVPQDDICSFSFWQHCQFVFSL